MSLFIGMLAFPDPADAAQLRLGVLAGSLLSAMAGYLILKTSVREPARILRSTRCGRADRRE